MTTENVRILTIPGFGGSGPDHWQSHWEKTDRRIQRVEQVNWNSGTRADWLTALNVAIQSSDKPVVLVAHSLGNIVVAHWAATHSGPVVAALLVAPADVEDPGWVDEGSFYAQFKPIPLNPLPFPSLLVTSTDDPYLMTTRAKSIASAWGSRLQMVGPRGHIGSDAKLTNWPGGQKMLHHLIAEVTLTEP